jgi:hypothetical protein
LFEIEENDAVWAWSPIGHFTEIVINFNNLRTIKAICYVGTVDDTGKGISKDSFVEDICNIDEACGHAKYPQLRHKKRMIYFIIFIMVMDLTHISNVHNLRTMHASGIQLW